MRASNFPLLNCLYLAQALWQLIGAVITILVAAIAGAITGKQRERAHAFLHFLTRLLGFIARLTIWQHIRESELYADVDLFEGEGECKLGNTRANF